MMMTTPTTIKAILFDFDGTLSQPGAIDFKKIRTAIGCPDSDPILEFIKNISDIKIRQNAWARLDEIELEAAAKTKPDPSAANMIHQLHSQKLLLGIISRNSRKSILCALENFNDLNASDFDLLITRDDPVEPKPSAQGIHWAAQKWGIETRQILLVGDYRFDIEAGLGAGCLTVLLDKKKDPRLADIQCDFRIQDLNELMGVLRFTQPLAAGKLPNDILEGFLRQFEFTDASVLVSAGIGDDTAAIDVLKEQILVLKSDPITFATEAISQYAVLVNANDIATAGAMPRWFLTTLLFPPKTTALTIQHIMHDLFYACKHWGITLCGGHTEITDAVTRPVVIGHMAGTVSKADLIDKKNMRPGDKIFITKSLAVEGTAIIAREFSDRLLSLGLSQEEINLGRSFLSKISILPEARLAANSKIATAIHDITEGGLATAVEELSIAGGHRLKINMDVIPFFPLTLKITTLLNIDPLGLIASGSLLICCKEAYASKLMDELHKNNIAATCIGKVLTPGVGVEAFCKGKRVPWPHFDVDEITRLF
jgi:hydrogenase expression/formation protein HypE